MKKLNPHHFTRKHIPKLLTFAALVVAAIATITYAMTGNVLLAAGLALILFIGDIIGVKMMVKAIEQKNMLPPDDDA